MKKAKDLLASNLIRLRTESGLTQAQLAEKAGLSLKMVQKIETCKVNPSGDTLDKLAKGLGVPMAEFFGTRPRAIDFTAVREGLDVVQRFLSSSQDVQALILALLFEDPDRLRQVSPAFVEQLIQALKASRK